jgi:hypothetical protein
MNTRESIELAFADVPYPGDDSITRCTREGCLECDEISAYFRGTTWCHHTLEQLWEHHSAITMFTPEALHYFLPAFMLQSLGHWREADMIPYFIAGKFSPVKPDADAVTQQYYADRWSVFSQQQREAVAAYLREYSASATHPWFSGDVDRVVLRLEAHETAEA